MSKRLDYGKASPQVLQAMLGLEHAARSLVADNTLYELVKIRASQINGCAYCLDMHTIDARAEGERENRIYLLSVWREAGELYTPRERAALAWTEALTDLPHDEVSDALFAEVRQHFTDVEIANLTMAVIAINGWNRIGVGLRSDVGSYQPLGKR